MKYFMPPIKYVIWVSIGLCSSNANAGKTIDFGEDQNITIGFGAITSYISEENAANKGNGWSDDFKVNSARLLLSGSLNKYIKGMLKTERIASTAENEIIDANVRFEFSPDLSIWAGRLLSPSDRSNMAGPYFSSGGGFWAGVAARYAGYGGIVGRDDGVAIVGRGLDQKLHYSFGAFDADHIFRFSNVGYQAESAGHKDHLMYSGRVEYDFWDAETGYYKPANYFGTKDVLSVGVAGRVKKNGVVSSDLLVGDYKSYSVDFLLEKRNFGKGTISIEGAYYHYDTDDIFLGEQGNSYLGGLGYIFNQKVGWGQFMPFIRYQKFEADGVTTSKSDNTRKNADTTKSELGINYVIDPYNMVITASYSNTKVTDKDNLSALKVAVQFQF